MSAPEPTDELTLVRDIFAAHGRHPVTDWALMADVEKALDAAEARGREIGNRERDADVERQRAVWQEQVAAAEARGFERGRQSAIDVCDAEIALHESVPAIRAIGNVRARILQAKEPR